MLGSYWLSLDIDISKTAESATQKLRPFRFILLPRSASFSGSAFLKIIFALTVKREREREEGSARAPATLMYMHEMELCPSGMLVLRLGGAGKVTMTTRLSDMTFCF